LENTSLGKLLEKDGIPSKLISLCRVKIVEN
jgi:serine/threonine protein kinase